jgi:hypothetical protein
MPSKKRSAANSPARRRKPPTFFVDRSLGGVTVPEALRAAGATVVALDERFTHDTPDEVWLSECGRRGWIVLTRDQRLRYRPAEIQALRESGCLVFVVTAGQMTGPDLAALLVTVLPAILDMALSSKRPAIYRVTSSGIRETVLA